MNITHDNDPFGINFNDQDKSAVLSKFIDIGNRFRANEIPMEAVSVEYFVVYKDAINYGFAQPVEKNVENPLENTEISSNFVKQKGYRTLLLLPIMAVILLLQPLTMLQNVLMKTADNLIQSNPNKDGN